MGSPEKPIDVELADMNPDVQMKGEKEELEPLRMHQEDDEKERFTGLTKEELLGILNKINKFLNCNFFITNYNNLFSFMNETRSIGD